MEALEKEYNEAYDDALDMELLAYGRSRDGAFWQSLQPAWEEAQNRLKLAKARWI